MLAAYVAPMSVQVEVGCLHVTIPPYQADRWLLAISDHPHGVIPGMLGDDDRATIMTALMVGTVTADDVGRAANDAISVAAGRPWWEAVRLVGYTDHPASELWGHLLLSGIHPERITIAGWCAALHTLITRNKDEKDRIKFDFDFKLPPQGVTDGAENWDAVEW